MKLPKFLALKPAGLLLGCTALFSAALCQTTLAQTPGSLDPAFTVGVGPADIGVRALIVQPDGKILIGGTYDNFDDLAIGGVVRVNADGSLDTSFNPGAGIAFSFPDSGVYALALQPDGKVIVAGIFDGFNGTPTSNIVRLNADGSLDTSFNGGTGVDDGIRSLALQPDGKVVIAGSFETVNGAALSALARLNADGSTDATFRSSGVFSSGSLIYQAVLQSDGKIVTVGNFTAGQLANVARINADGSLDGGFSTDFGADEVYTAAIEYDGKIVIGGPIHLDDFINGVDISRVSVARLNRDGSLDLSYDTDLGTTDFVPLDIAFQADGKAVIGGELQSTLAGPEGVIRLNTDGTLDTSYSVGAGTGGQVYAVAVQPDNNALVGGDFVGFEGGAANYLTRVVGGPLGAIPTPTPFPALPTVTVSVQSTKVAENAGKDKIVFTRSGDTSSDLTVAYSAKGSAQNGVNFKGLSGSVTIPAGSATKVVKAKILNDHKRDGTLVLKVTVLPSDSYTVGSPAKATIKILNVN